MSSIACMTNSNVSCPDTMSQVHLTEKGPVIVPHISCLSPALFLGSRKQGKKCKLILQVSGNRSGVYGSNMNGWKH